MEAEKMQIATLQELTQKNSLLRWVSNLEYPKTTVDGDKKSLPGLVVFIRQPHVTDYPTAKFAHLAYKDKPLFGWILDANGSILATGRYEQDSRFNIDKKVTFEYKDNRVKYFAFLYENCVLVIELS